MEVTATVRVTTQEAAATSPDGKSKVRSCPRSVSASAHTRDHEMATCLCHQGHPLVPVTVQMRSIDIDDDVKESKSNLQNISWTRKGKRAYHADMRAMQPPGDPSKHLCEVLRPMPQRRGRLKIESRNISRMPKIENTHLSQVTWSRINSSLERWRRVSDGGGAVARQ